MKRLAAIGFSFWVLSCGPAPTAQGELHKESRDQARAPKSDVPSPSSDTEPGDPERESASTSPPTLQKVALPALRSGPNPQLDQLVRELEEFAQKGKGHASVLLADLETGKELLGFRADEAENPASTQKILTAACALELLGPAYVFRTELRSSPNRDGHVDSLALWGSGAPDFSSADLYRFAEVIVQSGIGSVGRLIVDQTLWEEGFVPPAFEQQPDEWAPFRAPVSALSVDRNALWVHVLPLESEQPARVWVEPKGAAEIVGTVVTGPKGSADLVRLSTRWDPARGVLLAEVGGKIPAGAGRKKYGRRLEDPRLVPAHALSALLRDRGVKVAASPELGSAKHLSRIALLESEPLAELVRALGKESDNFTAEMLLVALSQKDGEGEVGGGPWSSARGARVLRKWMKDRGLDSQGTRIVNGSGLFDANRISARSLVQALRLMLERPFASAEFQSQLAFGGQDGTLKNRFGSGPLAGRVRAKTGTLKDVVALAGYVLREGGARPLLFSMMVGGVKGRHDEARRKLDHLVEQAEASTRK